MKSKHKIIIPILLVACAGLGYYAFRTDTVQQYKAKVLSEEFIPNQNFDIKGCFSFSKKDSIYKNFRSACPFHYQMLGLAKMNDSSYLFVIAEPPPFVKPDSILSVFKKFNIQAEIKTHPIGYDGWVKDMVVCVGRATTENINHLTKDLNKLIYLSDYKPFVTRLPLAKKRVYYSAEKLNYRISLAEINQWFVEDKELFTDLPDTTKTFSVPDVFKSRKTGIFYSKQPGFVIWSIDKKKDIYAQKSNIRKFTLDADLILGAISDSSTLVIIGREREADLMELPPLNVETILLLASIKDGELSQSLDVNDLLAGKMTNNKDWCPTYLSPQLENTEFGHLLTITDVLLKDWSESGTLRYEDYDYPKPAHYPFDRPLFAKLGLNELVYNWNTANTMFAYDYDHLHLYALNRTGSLPVSYFNPLANYISVGYQYENTAYNYFSGLCNTDLIRVVQYTSLYQIFMDNGIKNPHDTINYAPRNKPYLLYPTAKTLLSNIKNLPAGRIDSIAKQVGKKNYESFQHTRLLQDIDTWERNNHQKLPDNNREEIIANARLQNQQAIRSELSGLQSQLKSLNDNDFNMVCKYLSYPRGEQVSRNKIARLYPVISRTMHLAMLVGKTNYKELGIDLSGIKNMYSNALKNNSSPWMKTPSLIVSYNSPKLTGGHNLSSKIRRVNSINADKAIIASGRPQSVSRGQYDAPATPPPAATDNPNAAAPRTNKPAQRARKTSPPVAKNTKPTSTLPVRKRTEVISASQRGHRGF